MTAVQKRQRLILVLGVSIVILLLAAAVGGIVWACAAYYRYQRFQSVLDEGFGKTASVTAVDAEGERSALSDLNRYTLYTFLSDSSGKRTGKSEYPLTGRKVQFSGKSAVVSYAGSVSETEGAGIWLEFESGEEQWQYYIENRADFEKYERILSPEGWTEKNTPF